MRTVDTVADVSDAARTSPTVARQALRVARKGLKPLKGAKEVGGIFRQVITVAGLFKNLSKGLQIAIHVSKGPNIIFGLVAMKHAVDDVRKIIDRSKKPGDRFRASLLFVTHMESIIKTVATVTSILASAGAITKKAVQWVPIFNMISFAVGFISLGLSSYSVHKGRQLVQSFNEAMRAYQLASTQEEKAAALAKALDIIEKEGITPLRKQLMISKKGGVELTRRVDALRSHIATSAVTVADAELVKILARRAKTQLGFKAADLAGCVTGIVGSSVLIAPVPLVAQVIGTGILATAGAISLVSWGGRYFFINKDPFDETSKNRAMAILDDISHALGTVKKRLQTFALGKRGLPSPVAV